MSPLSDYDRSLIPLDGAHLESSLRAHVAATEFPCVGAKSALAKGTLRIEPAWSLVSGWDDVRIHQRLLEWSADYSRDPTDFFHEYHGVSQFIKIADTIFVDPVVNDLLGLINFHGNAFSDWLYGHMLTLQTKG